MDKKVTLKARGIRFPDETWKKLSDDAEKKSSTPSDIVRIIVDKHYQMQKSLNEYTANPNNN